MERFIARYRPLNTAVLSGFDRLVFRGWLIGLTRDGGMYAFLKRAGVRLLDFGDYVQETSERLKDASLVEARSQGRPIQYLAGAGIDKEALARDLLAAHPVEEGLVCAFTVVEPCRSFEYHRSKDPAERSLKLRTRKCLYIYKYYRHPVFGWIHARIQTWFPFSVQICLNGREWLAHQLQQEGRSDFNRLDNCLVWLGDPKHTIAKPRSFRVLRPRHNLRALLYPSSKPLSPVQTRRLSAKVTRQLRMLRAHGILRKVAKSHLYRLTTKGHLLTTALFAARRASVKQILAWAA